MAGRIHVIKVPDVGEGIAEVELVAWHVKPGDAVVEDQGLVDVMTDKANVEIPSPVAGRVMALGAEVGQVLAVGSELIRIERSGDDVPEAEAVREALPPSPVMEPAAAPKAVEMAPVPAHAAEDRPIASPAVRRRAWELGVDLKDVAPSGIAGRIVQADLDAHVAARGTRQAAGAPAALAAANAEHDEQQAIPVIGLRRRIALQMQESKRRIPHFSYVEEVDVTELEALRSALNAKWAATRGRLTLLPLLMRATVLAVREFPQVNARFDDEAGVVTRHGAVHIGIATQTPHGLVVPVVRHAQAQDLWAAAAEMARLADAARAGRATRAELSGSTITISSLGALGGIVSTPVINRPEVAIIAVNRIVERPVLRGGAVVARQMMNLSSSFDHRVVDGMDAAQFIQAMRTMIETPALLFVHPGDAA
ncbi:MAG: 2-oxo acid dehydrogenase subunit E2 [Proteobacteria bacterium]|nr:2-oxo acid dehydrogenase subunit E2 [Pseudomonadota bacterium]